MRLVDLAVVEHRADIIAGALLRIERAVARNVGGWIAAGVKRNAAIAPAEITHLHLIGANIAGKFVDKDNGNAAAHLLVIELDVVVRDEVRHISLAPYTNKSEVKGARRQTGVDGHDRTAVIVAPL